MLADFAFTIAKQFNFKTAAELVFQCLLPHLQSVELGQILPYYHLLPFPACLQLLVIDIDSSVANANLSNASVGTLISATSQLSLANVANGNLVNVTSSNLNVANCTAGELPLTKMSASGQSIAQTFTTQTGSRANVSTTATLFFTCGSLEAGKVVAYLASNKITSADYLCTTAATIGNTLSVGSNPILITTTGGSVMGSCASGIANINWIQLGDSCSSVCSCS